MAFANVIFPLLTEVYCCLRILSNGSYGIDTPEGQATNQGNYWTYANTIDQNGQGWWSDEDPAPSPFDYYTSQLGVEMGGSCPIVIFACNPQINAEDYSYYYYQDFAYNYLGRANETLPVDALFASCEMTLDGQPISIEDDWMYQDTQSGLLKVEWKNPNVRVDGLDGSLNGSMTINIGSEDEWPCQLNALQFRDKQGLITDHFATADEGLLTFAGGDFNMDVIANRMECQAPASLKAEWSPYGEGKWTAFEKVEEDPAKFCMPGIGRYYSAPLSEVSGTATKGWFDLRITIADAAGNTTEQTVSPAFRIDDLAGIQELTGGETQSCLYYNLQGRRINPANLQPGIYVRQTIDGKASKIAVK